MNTLARKFMIADEWMYLKIYSGLKTSETILIDVLYPLITQFEKDQIIEKWFFIRYADPNYHIRLRFLMSDPKHLGYILSQINRVLKPYVLNLMVADVQIGMYNRELERYGYENINFSESVFHYDSLMVTEMLRFIRSNENRPHRWLCAMKAIDIFLDDFKCDDNLKFRIMDELQESFGKEFYEDKFLRKQVNNKYSKFRRDIEGILNPQITNQSEKEAISILIDNKSQMLRRDAGRDDFITNFKSHKFIDILKSYIHMTMNRIIMSKSRLNEYVVYTFMFRHYKSEIARKKYSSKV